MCLAGARDLVARAFDGQQDDAAHSRRLDAPAAHVPRAERKAHALEHDVDRIQEILGRHVEQRRVFEQRAPRAGESGHVEARRGQRVRFDQRQEALRVHERDLALLQIGGKHVAAVPREARWHDVDQVAAAPAERMGGSGGAERTRIPARVERAADQRDARGRGRPRAARSASAPSAGTVAWHTATTCSGRSSCAARRRSRRASRRTRRAKRPDASGTSRALRQSVTQTSPSASSVSTVSRIITAACPASGAHSSTVRCASARVKRRRSQNGVRATTRSPSAGHPMSKCGAVRRRAAARTGRRSTTPPRAAAWPWATRRTRAASQRATRASIPAAARRGHTTWRTLRRKGVNLHYGHCGRTS